MNSVTSAVLRQTFRSLCSEPPQRTPAVAVLHSDEILCYLAVITSAATILLELDLIFSGRWNCIRSLNPRTWKSTGVLLWPVLERMSTRIPTICHSRCGVPEVYQGTVLFYTHPSFPVGLVPNVWRLVSWMTECLLDMLASLTSPVLFNLKALTFEPLLFSPVVRQLLCEPVVFQGTFFYWRGPFHLGKISFLTYIK